MKLRDFLESVPTTQPATVHQMPPPDDDYNLRAANIKALRKRLDDFERDIAAIADSERKKAEEFRIMREKLRNEQAKVIIAFNRERERLTPLIAYAEGDVYWHQRAQDVDLKPTWEDGRETTIPIIEAKPE